MCLRDRRDVPFLFSFEGAKVNKAFISEVMPFLLFEHFDLRYSFLANKVIKEPRGLPLLQRPESNYKGLTQYSRVFHLLSKRSENNLCFPFFG